ncbi:hypothetical protein JW964_29100 [candidate division KSB1 bacterium]|nr:hypothetical protein [candidate division KSB1 bacterium]
MSFKAGWAAVNLEMTPYIPRVEFDAERHWELVKIVTGIDVNFDSPQELKTQASKAFMRAWDYSIYLCPLIGGEELQTCHSSMGHSVYEAGGIDYNTNIFSTFKDPEEVYAFDPAEVYGHSNKKELIRRFNEHYQSQKENYPEVVNTTGTYVTLFSGMIDIFGWDMILLAGGLDPQRFGAVVNRYAAWMQPYYEAIAECDAPIIYSHDDIVWTAGAVFHPEWYRKYIFPNYKKYYAPLIEAGKKVIFISDGNYTEFIDDIAATGAAGFFLEPLTSLEHIVEYYDQTHIIIGNANTHALLYGSRNDIYREVERCIKLGKKCPGYFIGVSNMIPSNTPVENALYYNEVYKKLCHR